jgi:hypothetical protein
MSSSNLIIIKLFQFLEDIICLYASSVSVIYSVGFQHSFVFNALFESSQVLIKVVLTCKILLLINWTIQRHVYSMSLVHRVKAILRIKADRT